MKFVLPPLPYDYAALEPHIDEATMKLHHDKHHQTYVDKLNLLMDKHPELDQPIESLLQGLNTITLDDQDRTTLRNHGGGHANHAFFWNVMAPTKQIDEALQDDLKHEFGSIEVFKKTFTNSATGHFGSGWTWLVRDETNKLQLYSLPNQDSPLSQGHTPVFALDLWEHAYYLKYQNRRAEYIAAWWNVLKSIE